MKIAITSGKGGVGKSMLASSLAMLFAQKKKRVAVDCDVDAPNLHLWLGENEKWDEVEKISVSEKPVIDIEKCTGCGRCAEICAFDALRLAPEVSTYPLPRRQAGDPGSEQTYLPVRQTGDPGSKMKFNPFFCEGCGACEVICPVRAITMEPVENAEIRIKEIQLRQGFAGQAIHGFPLVSAQLYPGMTGSGKIVEEIKKRAERFDWEVMILDSPAGTGCPVIAAVKDADFAVLVTEPTPSGFSDMKRALTMINYFKIPYGIVINKWDINVAESNKIEKWAQGKLLGKISYDKRIFQTIANLIPIMEASLPVKDEIKKIKSSLSSCIHSLKGRNP